MRTFLPSPQRSAESMEYGFCCCCRLLIIAVVAEPVELVEKGRKAVGNRERSDSVIHGFSPGLSLLRFP